MADQSAKKGPGPRGEAPEAVTPGTGSAEAEVDGDGGTEEEGRRPTPVRMVMEGGEGNEDESTGESRIVHDEQESQDWMVKVSGRSGSGILPRRTVQLMELTFSRAEDPDEPLRRVLCHGEDLLALSEAEVLAFLRESEPYRKPQNRQDRNEGQKRKGRRKNRRGPRG